MTPPGPFPLRPKPGLLKLPDGNDESLLRHTQADPTVRSWNAGRLAPRCFRSPTKALDAFRRQYAADAPGRQDPRQGEGRIAPRQRDNGIEMALTRSGATRFRPWDNETDAGIEERNRHRKGSPVRICS